jgi:AcrR family transcriptional regulator
VQNTFFSLFFSPDSVKFGTEVQKLNTSLKLTGTERRIRRSETRRREILHAAASVFREHGYNGAGMRDIADAAQLSPGNLYYYFKGKQEILYFCQDRALEQMLTSLKLAQEQSGKIAARLGTLIRAHLHSMLDDFEGSIAHLMIGGLPPELRDRLIQKRDQYEKGIRELIEQGIDRGEFTRQDSTLVTRAILGASNWTAQWFNPHGRLSVEQIADTLANYLLRGLTTDNSAPAGRLGKGDTND